MLLVAVLATACSDRQTYDVATCSFGATESACSPTSLPDMPREWFVGSLALVNPNPGVPLGCTGTVDIEVRSGEVHWHATELDAASCQQVGAAQEGSGEIGDGFAVDIAFPQGDFTFRLAVVPSDEPPADSAH